MMLSAVLRSMRDELLQLKLAMLPPPSGVARSVGAGLRKSLRPAAGKGALGRVAQSVNPMGNAPTMAAPARMSMFAPTMRAPAV